MNMEKNKNDIVIRSLTFIFAVLCVLFFIGMIVLFAFTIIINLNSRTEPDNHLQIDNLMVLKNGENEVPDGFDLSYVVPEFIGITFSEKSGRYGFCANEMLVKQLYSALSEHMLYVMGPSYVCEVLSEKDGEDMWDLCYSKRDSVYIKYRQALPGYVLRGFFDGRGDDSSASGTIIAIKEIFLLFDYSSRNSYTLRAFARDNEGRVVSYSYSEGEDSQKAFSKDDISSFLRVGGTHKFSFAFETPELFSEYPSLGDSAVIFTDTLKLSKIYMNDTEAFEYNKNEILALLGYNINKLNFYTEAEGSENYVERFGNLRIAKDGSLTFYASDNGGIPLSDFLNYGNSGGEYNINETICAMCAAVMSIRDKNSKMYGGDAHPALSSLTYDSDERILTASFIYVYEGVDLYKNGEKCRAASVSVRDDSIIRIELYAFNVLNTAQKTVNIPQLWQLGSTESAESIEDMSLAYLLREAGEYYCDWVCLKKSDPLADNIISDGEDAS